MFERCLVLTQEWILKTLINHGFRQRDAEVYVFLTLNGTHKASEIAKANKLYKQQVYQVLKKLQNQKIVSRTQKVPAHFSALPFDKLLDLLKKANLQEANRIEKNKESLLTLWDSTVKENQAN
jgi:sugar-specific transcriptional regulator TrmB